MKKMTAYNILKICCKYFNETIENVTEKCRKSEITQIRFLIMAAIRKHTNASLPKIGGIFKRDHTTVMHALKRVNNDEKLIQNFKELCEFIKVNQCN